MNSRCKTKRSWHGKYLAKQRAEIDRIKQQLTLPSKSFTNILSCAAVFVTFVVGTRHWRSFVSNLKRCPKFLTRKKAQFVEHCLRCYIAPSTNIPNTSKEALLECWVLINGLDLALVTPWGGYDAPMAWYTLMRGRNPFIWRQCMWRGSLSAALNSCLVSLI